MFHQIRWFWGSAGLMLCLTALPLHAGLVTFSVDLLGTSGTGTEHTLRVYGTITVDPELPLSAAATTSNLFFQHNLDASQALPSTWNSGQPNPTQLKWSVTDGNLYISRTGTATQVIAWNTSPKPGEIMELAFGSGANAHSLYNRHSDGLSFDLVELKGAGGVDEPNGFLVGTAIPEPSSALLITGFGAMFPLLRWRRV